MFLTHATRLFYDALLTLAYPQSCAICCRSVEQRRFGVACEACWNATRILSGTETICWKCGLLSEEVTPARLDEVRCRRCEAQSFTAARAIGPYEGALRASVLELKRQPHQSQHLETLLLAAARREPLNVCAQDHSGAASRQAAPVERLQSGLHTRAGIIQRAPVADGRSQSGARLFNREIPGRAGRQRPPGYGRGAFEVRHPRLIANEDILLVDDVFTTGATVSACAEALLGAGARNVFVLTIARAIRHTDVHGYNKSRDGLARECGSKPLSCVNPWLTCSCPKGHIFLTPSSALA